METGADRHGAVGAGQSLGLSSVDALSTAIERPPAIIGEIRSLLNSPDPFFAGRQNHFNFVWFLYFFKVRFILNCKGNIPLRASAAISLVSLK